jgi:hypothetical protein
MFLEPLQQRIERDFAAQTGAQILVMRSFD